MNAFVTLAEVERALLHDKPRRRFVIPGVLPAGPVLLYGSSGAGKTGLAIRTAVAIAAGLDWADRPVSAGSVLYVAGEDIEGAKVRLVAAARELGLDPAALPVAIMEAPADGLVTTSARLAVAAAAKALAAQTGLPVAAIVVDTLAACFGPESQDDATAASRFMSHADRTARELECAFLSVHHTGKNESSGMRGSRVFFDRADAVLRVNKGKGGTSFVEVEKQRNGPGGARFAFDIAGLDVATAGGAVSAQVIRLLRGLEPASLSPDEAKAAQKQTLADQMLGVLARVGGTAGASMAAWQSATYDLWPSKKQATKRQLFSQNRKSLVDSGLVRIEGDIVSVSVSEISTDAQSLTPSPEQPASASASFPPSLRGERTDALAGRLPVQRKAKHSSEVKRGKAVGRVQGGEGDLSPSLPSTAAALADADTGTEG